MNPYNTAQPNVSNLMQKLQENFELVVMTAITFRSSTYATVDAIYNERPVYYHELAGEAVRRDPKKFQNVFIYTAEMDFKSRQALGIYEHARTHPEDASLIDRIINKGFKDVRRFVDRSQGGDVFELYFRTKYKNLDDVVMSQLVAEACAALYYGSRLQKPVEISASTAGLLEATFNHDDLYKGSIETLKDNESALRLFFEAYNLEVPTRTKRYTLLNYLLASVKDAKDLSTESKLVGLTMSVVADFFDMFQVDSTTLHSHYEVTGEEILVCAQYAMKVRQDADEAGFRLNTFSFFMFYLHGMVLAKLYSETKTLANVNTVTEWTHKLQAVEKEADKKVKKYEKEIAQLRQQNARLTDLHATSVNLNQELRHRLDHSEKRAERLASFEQEVIGLRNYVYSQQTDPAETNTATGTESDWLKTIQSYQIAVFGGHTTFTSKLKEVLPDVRFIGPEESGKNFKFVQNLDAVFVFTEYFNHGTYYKLLKQLDDTTRLIYLPKIVNRDRTLSFMATALTED